MLSVGERRAAKTARRLRNRDAKRRFHARLRAAGYTHIPVWVAREWAESIADRSRRWQMTRRSIILATLEVGLRHLRSEDVQRVDARWRAVAGPYAATMLRAGRWRALRGADQRFVGFAKAAG